MGYERRREYSIGFGKAALQLKEVCYIGDQYECEEKYGIKNTEIGNTVYGIG